MPTEGTPNFNAIAILEIEKLDWRAGHPAIMAKAAFINTRNGKTYGHASLSSCWTKETLDLLEQLRTAMEQDMGRYLFDDVQTAAAQPEIPTPQPKQHIGERPLGIGEELEVDAKQI